MKDRREFLKTGTFFLTAGTLFSTQAGQPLFSGEPVQKTQNVDVDKRDVDKRKVRIGAPLFVPDDDLDRWAKAAVERGYRAVYAPQVDLKDASRVRDVTKTAEKYDLVIAEVGRWVNLMDADPEKRKQNMALVTEGLAVADAIGARCCVDIAGSFDKESWFGPSAKNLSDEFFELAVENARTIIDAVKPKRAKFAYEMMGWAVPDSAESYLKLLKAIDRKGFGVHIDVCNMVNSPKLFFNTTKLINETFDLLGEHIVSAHAKDLRWNVEMNLHFVECPLGQGPVDYETYLRRMAMLPGDVPLMIEHMKDQAEYDLCHEYLKKIVAG
ncbi:MAG: sugar phosphate isomerase/epimerase [Planctomycetaceae bacterium]|nr:sugar phosphate isomerase/epimerase [Planctomycetaceae bacterium]